MPSARKLTVPPAPCVMLVTTAPALSKWSLASALKVTGVSSSVIAASATMSATAVTVSGIVPEVVASLSVVVTVMAALPL